jgi:hypothetical protein
VCGGVGCVVVWVGVVVWGVWWCGVCGGVGGVGCGGCGGVVGVVVWWVGLPLRSNIPRSALCATLDPYNFIFILIIILCFTNI